MATRYNKKHLDLSREKIQTSQLINRLQKNGLAQEEFLTQGQIRSIEILLKKSVPDLSATEITGDTVSYVVKAPDVMPDAASWELEAKDQGKAKH